MATRKPIKKRSVPATATKKKAAAPAVAKRQAAGKKAAAAADDAAEVEVEAAAVDSSDDGEAPAGKSTGRRATAQSMASKQRDISVSEFFAKNRHLLGFDNPRKALLTTIKEAVDNSLDACEEAGILPEIWVHIEQTSTDRYKIGVQDNGPGIVKKQIPLIFGKLLYGSKFHRLRQSRGQQGIGISAAGMYGVQTTGKPVKIISRISAKKAGPLLRNSDRHEAQRAEDSQRRRRRGRHRPRRQGRQGYREAWHRVGRSTARHAGDDRTRGEVQPRPRQRRRIPAPNGDRESPHHAPLHGSRGEHPRLPAGRRQAAAGAEGNSAPSVRHRARPPGGDACRSRRDVDHAVPVDEVLAGVARRGEKDLHHGEGFARGR